MFITPKSTTPGTLVAVFPRTDTAPNAVNENLIEVGQRVYHASSDKRYDRMRKADRSEQRVKGTAIVLHVGRCKIGGGVYLTVRHDDGTEQTLAAAVMRFAGK